MMTYEKLVKGNTITYDKEKETICITDPGGNLVSSLSLEDSINVVRFIESVGIKDARPICPDCKTIMVKTHIELDDDSGWFSGWVCDCKYEPNTEA